MARRAQLDCQVGLEVRQLGFAGSRYIYSCDGFINHYEPHEIFSK